MEDGRPCGAGALARERCPSEVKAAARSQRRKSKAAGEGARATQAIQASTGAPVATGNFASCQAPNPPLTFITFLKPARCRRLQAIRLR